MNEKIRKIAFAVLAAAVFVLSVALVVVGQRHIGASGLRLMLVGLAGLIVLLWMYNRRYK